MECYKFKHVLMLCKYVSAIYCHGQNSGPQLNSYIHSVQLSLQSLHSKWLTQGHIFKNVFPLLSDSWLHTCISRIRSNDGFVQQENIKETIEYGEACMNRYQQCKCLLI